ncbi:MAG: hypothetical protein JSW34_13315 [Candidatus Zixiibacteriota bacterium]|nr:MAG: hypothetical protein JSW34_13315 [candidate division Zixibacteria bacterium]
MEVGLVYSSKDPRQVKARDFVINFIKERGILANVVESDEPVESPTVIINGLTLTDLRTKPRRKNAGMFPDLATLARILEKQAWCL